ncbi:MAG: nucleotide exchange factor GrpE, partial [Actinobacteria bacterium]|nr:nucleotide exchange factor GrpE [Actinomycetota bacterium]
GKEGLVRIVPTGEPFDPATHEAVMHEEGEGGDPVVSETLRPGYGWRGRLVRAAMVQVRG